MPPSLREVGAKRSEGASLSLAALDSFLKVGANAFSPLVECANKS